MKTTSNTEIITPRSVVQIYPPLPKNYTPPSEEVIKTLWSIRNLNVKVSVVNNITYLEK